MGQQLNIKSEDAHALATELSKLTGQSLTMAVTSALREKLDRTRKLSTRDAKIERVREIAADIRAHMTHPLTNSDHSWLYDEDGLPK